MTPRVRDEKIAVVFETVFEEQANEEGEVGEAEVVIPLVETLTDQRNKRLKSTQRSL